MLSDINKTSGTGALSGPPQATSVLTTVLFIRRHLVEFSNTYSVSKINNEKGLTQKLSNMLNAHAQREGYSFWFDKEYMEDPESGTSPQVDIGVITSLEDGISIESKLYSSDESFFSVEAKRLGCLEKKREKEYLVGRFENSKYKDCGGVERFKKGIHGKNLKYAGIIGYVQEHNFQYW